jgi:hypothetical protein
MHLSLPLVAAMSAISAMASPLFPNVARDNGSVNGNSVASTVARSLYINTKAKVTAISTVMTRRFASTISTIDHSISTTNLKQRQPSSTTNSSTVYTKTNVSDCNVQGTASADLTARKLWTMNATDVLQCQLYCRATTPCISYSFQPQVDVNCVFYNAWTGDWTSSVIKSETSGIFFSNKYPSDGSDFCYSDKPLN